MHLILNPWIFWMLLRFLLVGLCLSPALALADASRPGQSEPGGGEDEWQFKLTPSYYSTTHQASAFDLNLRANHGPHAFWLGNYRRADEFEQQRAGYELSLDGENGRLIPSVQWASHGFRGAAVNLEFGRQIYGLLGYGRTNARDYYNLNFDPNDAVTLGLGTRLLPASNLLWYSVRDNRLHTGQVVQHLLLRIDLPERQRLSLDAFAKHGRATPEDDPLDGGGLALTYDFRDWFVRLVRDRKVNFTPENQTRFALGFRF